MNRRRPASIDAPAFTVLTLLGVGLVLSGVGGCANWNSESWSSRGWSSQDTRRSASDGDAAALPMVRESPKAVIVDVEFVRFAEGSGVTSDAGTTDSEGRIKDLWHWTDATGFDPRLRRRLLVNGIRVGRVTNTDRFNTALRRARPKGLDGPDQFLSSADLRSELGDSNRRHPLRYGRRHELPLRQTVAGELAGLLRSGDQTVGRTLVNPLFLFAVTPEKTASPKQVRLRIDPEVQHGKHRQTFVSRDSAIRIDSKRDAWKLDDLSLTLRGGEGDVFVFGCTETLAGMGRHMFAGRDADGRDQRVLLVMRIRNVPEPIDEL